mgnify:CR=1 FL=1
MEFGPRLHGRAEASTEVARVKTLGPAQSEVIALARGAVELAGRLEPEVTSRKVATDNRLSHEPKVLLVFSFNNQTSEVGVKQLLVSLVKSSP